MEHDKKNIMVILSSPSGVGKTTLTKKIQQKYHSFKISVSHTTRSPRSNEVDGVDYHFVSTKRFKDLINEKKFYEYGYLRKNPAGSHRELWYHEQGDRSWLIVTRNTISHEIVKVELARDIATKKKAKVK